LLDVINST